MQGKHVGDNKYSELLGIIIYRISSRFTDSSGRTADTPRYRAR